MMALRAEGLEPLLAQGLGEALDMIPLEQGRGATTDGAEVVELLQ